MATQVAPTVRPWRLSARARKSALVVHIVSAGTWFGLDVVMAVIVFTSLTTDSQSTKALAYQALETFVLWPLVASGVVCLASGVLLGLGTTYGLIRYWWVTIKLVLNIVLTTLVLVALRPGVSELADQARRSAAGEIVTFVESNIIFPPVVSTTALLVAFLLSVFKPWGRIRSTRGYSSSSPRS